MDIEERIRAASNEIRSLDAIAIIGAGISLGRGFPLTLQLRTFLWQALDADEVSLNALAKKFGQDICPAKILIGDDPYRISAALDAIASSSIAWRKFQHSFKNLNDERINKPSIAHDIIAELLHRRKIKIVISLNWDTLLEASYHKCYGSTLIANGDWLKKPHGDAANPDSKWIYPNEPGLIPEGFLQKIQQIVEDHPHVLLIIGYSESDEEVVSKIIQPLSAQWRVIRIGPNATGEYSIPLKAEEALPSLLREIDPNVEVPGWEYVNFDIQHGDLGSALIGRGLGPADVKLCPRLPEVDKVKQQLDIAKSAVIIGKAGCGKSIIGYQAAYDLMKDGWEIIRLSNYDQLKEKIINPVLYLSCRTVLIIDNAHLLDRQIIPNILEKASNNLLIIAISTVDSINDAPVNYDNIQVASERAVSVIAEAFRNRCNEILPIVRKLDSNVGERLGDISLEDRISEAAKSDTPWQFNFILTGGWHRASDEIALLRESERFDLILTAIATGQFVTLDAGCSLEWIEDVAFQIYGKDADWLNRGLHSLKSRRLIIDEKTLRFPHLRLSRIVLDIAYKDRNDYYWDKLIEMFRAALLYKSPPLLGINWALHALRFNEMLWNNKSDILIDCDTWKIIFNRCLESKLKEDRGNAAFVLNTLIEWYRNQIDELAYRSKLIGQWVEEVDSNSAAGIGCLLNDLGQKDHSLTEQIIGYSNPIVIASSLAKASISEAFTWGHFLGRLAFAASHCWSVELKKAFDTKALGKIFVDAKVSDLEQISELAEGIACFDEDLSLELVNLSLETIINSININAIKFQEIHEIISFVLGYAPDFLRYKEPSENQRQIAYKLVNGLNPKSISHFISVSSSRDWESYADLLYFIDEVMPEKAKQIALEVNFDVLDGATQGLWNNPPSELLFLIDALAVENNYDPARSWVNRHNGELVKLDTILAAVAPEAVASALRSGHSLDLHLGDYADWNLAAIAIQSLSEVDKVIAFEVLNHNSQDISKGFLLKRNDCEFKNFPLFLSLMSELAPDVLKRSLDSVDPTIIETNWVQRLHGKEEEQQAVKSLIKFIISSGQSYLSDIAKKLI